jgi:hypothetical protein
MSPKRVRITNLSFGIYLFMILISGVSLTACTGGPSFCVSSLFSGVRNLRQSTLVVLPLNACLAIPHAHAYVFSRFLLVSIFKESGILVRWLTVYQTPLSRIIERDRVVWRFRLNSNRPRSPVYLFLWKRFLRSQKLLRPQIDKLSTQTDSAHI